VGIFIRTFLPWSVAWVKALYPNALRGRDI
jgi:hypothetical protein